jgi:hypothetical protein
LRLDGARWVMGDDQALLLPGQFTEDFVLCQRAPRALEVAEQFGELAVAIIQLVSYKLNESISTLMVTPAQEQRVYLLNHR